MGFDTPSECKNGVDTIVTQFAGTTKKKRADAMLNTVWSILVPNRNKQHTSIAYPITTHSLHAETFWNFIEFFKIC